MKSARLSADEARWRVPVPANGEATVTATFDTPLLIPMRALASWSRPGAAGARGGAQAIVTSPGPDRVAVTVYRNPDRGLNR